MQNRAVGKCGVQFPRCTLTTEYTFIRYFPCKRETSAESVGTPRSPFGRSDHTYTETSRTATGEGDDKCKGQ